RGRYRGSRRAVARSSPPLWRASPRVATRLPRTSLVVERRAFAGPTTSAMSAATIDRVIAIVCSARVRFALVLAAVCAVVAGCGGSRPTDDVIAAAPLAMADRTASLQQDYVRVVKSVSPSVVQIRTPQDLGSGIVFDAAGDVVTNAHVVG